MDIAALLGLLGPGGFLGLGSLLVSIYVAVGNRRMATVDALDKLCTQLQERIKANDDEIASLRRELKEVREENAILRERIRTLEHENINYARQLAELQAKRARRGKKQGA